VNPQVAVATDLHAINTVPSFIHLYGPVREARFKRNANGSADGGVHSLFVVSGRDDAPGCDALQEDFEAQVAGNNIIFRIPTPTFGAGLIEMISDADIEANRTAHAAIKAFFGISGRPNRNGNDGTIARFGWKAQNKSLLLFAGEAYNVEQGVTNELFPNERETDPNCQFNPLPEDPTRVSGITSPSASPASDFSADIVNFAGFMRMLAPPTPQPLNASTSAGSGVFANIGCDTCHLTNQFSTRPTPAGPLTTFQPFGDFALHKMGTKLADGIVQGGAAGDEFRTAPLWGLGQRIFLLHDGRTTDLVRAIREHSSIGSEATAVIANFERLPVAQKQDLLNFLRSL